MSPYARDYLVYLRRRVEDVHDPERPAPKWTELDYTAIAKMLRELDDLRQFHDDAAQILQKHNIALSRPYTSPRQSAADAPAPGSGVPWQVVLILIGVIIGAFAREIIMMF